MGNRAQIESWRLQSLTSVDLLPDYDSNPSWYYGCERALAHPSSLTALPFTIACPKAFRKRGTTASAGAGHSCRPRKPTPACSTPRARIWPAFLLEQFGTQTIIGHDVPPSSDGLRAPKPPALTLSTRSKTTRRLPGWLPESSDSSFLTNSTPSRSTRQSPTTPRPDRESSLSTHSRRSSRTAGSSIAPLII